MADSAERQAGDGELLRMEGVQMRFGGIWALAGLDMVLRPLELVGLIGPNGAGKTTVFNVITGVYRPQEGRILLEGQEITGKARHRIARRGIARTFQNIRLFGALPVIDNVKIAYHHHVRTGMLGSIVRSGRSDTGVHNSR